MNLMWNKRFPRFSLLKIGHWKKESGVKTSFLLYKLSWLISKTKIVINIRTGRLTQMLFASPLAALTSIVGSMAGRALLNMAPWLFCEVQDVVVEVQDVSAFSNDIEFCIIETVDVIVISDVSSGLRVALFDTTVRVTFTRVSTIPKFVGVTDVLPYWNVLLLHRSPVQHSIEQLLMNP